MRIQQLQNKYRQLSLHGTNFLSPFLFAYYFIHRAIEKLCMVFIKISFPIDEKLVVFRSLPDYADNARALAEYMVANGYLDKYEICFDVKDLKKFRNRYDGVTFISCETDMGLYRFKFLRTICTAKYLMFTHKPILIRKRARKEQRIVNLWHGCGYKDRSSQQGNGRAPFDVGIVPGELFVKTKSYFWNIEEKGVLPIGYPRFDWLKSNDHDARILLDSFKTDFSSKVILWMPTYRIDKRGVYTDSDSIKQFPLIDSDDRWNNLDVFCKNHHIVLIIKLHPFQKEYSIPFHSFSNIKKIDNDFFEKADVPMYKFIALTDALISDYSSIAVDYLIVNRPMAFTLDDFEEYRKTRGFVFDDPRIYMPGHHLYSFQDLKIFLSDVAEGKDEYRSQREQMYGKAICYSDNYSKSILDRLGIQL